MTTGRAGPPRPLVGPFTGRQLAVGFGAIVVAAIVLVAISRPIAAVPPNPTPLDPAASQYIIGPAQEGLQVGDRPPEPQVKAPNGSLVPLTDLDGRPIRLSDLRGHPVWIDFWASWCPPCQSETPVLRDMYKSYRDRGLVLIAISVQETSAADVRGYAERYELPYRVAADLTGDVFRSYHIYGLPTQFFLDANGIIRAVVQGPVTYDSAAADLQLIVPGGAPSGSTPGSAVATPSPGPSSS